MHLQKQSKMRQCEPCWRNQFAVGRYCHRASSSEPGFGCVPLASLRLVSIILWLDRERFIFTPAIQPQAWHFLYDISTISDQRISSLLMSGHSEVFGRMYLPAAHHVRCSEYSVVCMNGTDEYGSKKTCMPYVIGQE